MLRVAQGIASPSRALDADTVAELVGLLEERLQKLEGRRGECPQCRDAEAAMFLARMRDLLRRLRSASR